MPILKSRETTLRALFIATALIAVLSVSIGGYLYYSSLVGASLEAAYKEAKVHVNHVKNGIDSYLEWSLRSVKMMAGLEELKRALSTADPRLSPANRILDHFQASLGASVCYVMDDSGTTLASSNRTSPDSFVGKNYAFRPYFQEALEGNPSVYMALGVTSKKRGAYFGHPVFREETSEPSGVAVIKASVDPIQDMFKKSGHGILALVDPNGIIFLSSHANWEYHALFQISADTAAAVKRSKQFGPGPFESKDIRFVGGDKALDPRENPYHVYQHEIAHIPGWRLIYLLDENAVIRNELTPIRNSIGILVIELCALTVLATLLLYKRADSELKKRKKAEKELQTSEEKLRHIVENASNLFYSHTADHKLTYISPQSREYLQCEPEEALIRWTEFATENPINEKGVALTEKAIETGTPQEPYELELVGKEGKKILVEVRETPIVENGKTVAIVGALTDITERKKAEAALRESELFYRTILEASPILFVVHKDGRIQYINKAGRSLLGGKAPPDMTGRNVFDFVRPDFKEEVKDRFARLKAGQANPPADIGIVRTDGTQAFVQSTSLPIHYQGEPAALLMAVDITDRKRAEAALKNSENRYRTIFENSVVGFFQSTPQGRFLRVNAAFSGMLRYDSPEDVISGISDISTQYYENPEDRRRFQQVLQEQGYIENYEFQARCKDGSNLWVSNSTRAYFDEKGEVAYYEGIVIDISKRKQAEKEKDALILQLRKANEEIRQLRGIIPICSICKKVRDDKGYWNQIESYIAEHSEAEFSHGICKECAAKYYSEYNLYDDKR